MAKSRSQKATTLDVLARGFKDAKSVAFADYRGLTVVQVDELRKSMRKANVQYIVAKKTLVTKAAKEAGFDLNAKQYQGMLGVAFGLQDEIAPAKILGDLSKTTTVQLVGGIFDGALVSKEHIIALSKLPSKLELLGTVVGTIYAPVSAFVRVLNAIREAREASEGAPVAARSAAVSVDASASEVGSIASAQVGATDETMPTEVSSEAQAETSSEEAEKSES